MQFYDDKTPRKFIVYLHANNLYGWTMSKYYPYSEFKWLNQKEIDKFDVNLIGENSYAEYISKFDSKYLDELHKLHRLSIYSRKNWN